MTKLNHIEQLLEAIRDDKNLTKEERNAKHDLVDESIKSFVDYHNEAVSQGHALTMARFRMDFETFAKYVENLHETRKELHKSMIDHTAVLNHLCEDYGMKKIYEGPLNLGKGRDDSDTRFGVAEFGAQMVDDLFKASEMLAVPRKAVEAYKDYSDRLHTEGKKWNIMDKMMQHASAQKNMAAADDAFAAAINAISEEKAPDEQK